MNWLRTQLQSLVALYRSSAWFRGLVQAAEAGAVMSVASISLDPNDLFTRNGLKHVAVAVVGGVVFAVRNYLVNRPGQPAGEPPTTKP
jgi:hypothetical protein